jgi:hypothetical protein
VRWQRDVPAHLRALDTFPRADYEDVFTATTDEPGDGREPERWARDALEPASRRIRLLTRTTHCAQRALLGLRLDSRPSPDRLFGWCIAARGEDWMRLEAASWMMSAHLVFRRAGTQLACATFVRYDRRIAAYVWPPVSRLHRVIGIALMRHTLHGPPARTA